ncbi:MAG: SUF system NifU family Fe-S cluster assembly protein [candidate division Zixibacteria bacterium HGW-Zixibacteria-1]|nr:MAG: SUF system NifU family Fe-S cluster assembly protein [candidate division Zixibacteria bacterium HGW-Zixibacteria-1]
MSDQLSDLYRDIIMEHYRFPRGHHHVDNPDIANQGQNPVCGDEIEIKLKMAGEKVEDISVNCVGCAISVASGSMLAEIIEGKTLPEIKKIAEVVKKLLKGEDIDEKHDLGDLEALRGVKKFPLRVKCALLSWTTLVDAINAGQADKSIHITSTEK